MFSWFGGPAGGLDGPGDGSLFDEKSQQWALRDASKKKVRKKGTRGGLGRKKGEKKKSTPFSRNLWNYTNIFSP